MSGESKLTLSVMTADVGGFIGHVSSHPELLDTAKERLYDAKEKGVITDFHVLRCGDDIGLIMTHGNGCGSRAVHELAWNIFTACRNASVELKLHAPERGISKEEFTGTLRQMGPGVAEAEIVERASEPVVILMANKTSRGTWNLPLYKLFADPFNTPGLLTDPSMLGGFSFKVADLQENLEITLSAPGEIYYLLALIGSTDRYVVTSVHRSADSEVAAVVSSEKFNLRAEKVAARCEPALIIRCQTGLPSVGEAMEAFSTAHLVGGWMRGSYNGPLLPVPFYEANPTRFDGPPRAIAAGFQLSRGRLIGPHDMFDDPSFDEPRRIALQMTEYLRRQGPFKPHRMPSAEMEYTATPLILDRLKERFRKV
ncbi:MAG: fructose 1,6-bisphosphatase [Deltaproteobacteria bacterium]|nr:fructose 1,6-bisphosphatase [Deltaproteobacteria bacterium]